LLELTGCVLCPILTQLLEESDRENTEKGELLSSGTGDTAVPRGPISASLRIPASPDTTKTDAETFLIH